MAPSRQALLQACARGDFAAVADLAHWLKGSGGTVGYDAFYEPARRLEDKARSGDASGMTEAIAALRTMSARLLVPDEAAANSPQAAGALQSA